MAKKSVLMKMELEQNAEREQEQSEKILIASPRKLLLGFTNPYLACEFAYHMARFTNLKVLVIDADGLAPAAATYLGMKDLVNPRIQSDAEGNSAFNMALDYICRTPRPVPDVFRNITVEHPTNKNLSVLTGNDDMQRYEDYSTTTFELLLKHATDSFDLVAVVVPYNIYDSFYLTALNHVEYMIYGFEAYADSLMAYNGMMMFLDSCGRAPLKKHQYVAFNYNSTHLSFHDIKLAVDNQVLGVVSGESGRLVSRNEFNKTYARSMSKKNTNEYHRLARSFGYTTKKGLFGRKG